MKKSRAIQIFNRQKNAKILNHRNTTFAQISSNRAAWWMNIKLHRFNEEINIILIENKELVWLQIPPNTFTDIKSNFKIWEAKDAVDIHISADRNDRYMIDIASGGSQVNFKPFIKVRIEIPEKFLNSQESERKPTGRRLRIPNASNNPGQKIIRENQSNISYKLLFQNYLVGSNKITIQDPYIRYHHQFENLVEFCQLLEEVKKDGQDLHFELVTWNSDDFQDNSREYLQSLSKVLVNLESIFPINLRISMIGLFKQIPDGKLF